MKRRLLQLLAALWLAACFPAAAGDAEGVANNGGVVINPAGGEIATGSTLTITFPESMAAAGEIDAAGQPCPLASDPKLPGSFLWKSQTEGDFTVDGPVIPGAVYRFSLAPGLKSLAGHPVEARQWGAQFKADPFQVEFSDADIDRKHLAARPQIYLSTNYDVSFSEVAGKSWFQDKDSFKRYPVEVIKTSEADLPEIQGHEFALQPRADLPAGRAYDLVISGLADLKTRTPLPHLEVFPAGTTASLEMKWLGAFNNPLEKPAIRAQFNDRVDADTVSPATFLIEPAVRNLKIVAQEDEIVAQGDFNLQQHYSVSVSPGIKGKRGYGLAAPAKWGATFKPKRPAVLFPGDERILQRSGSGLRFTFLQVNTALLTWNLAEIPLEKLGAVSDRIREFQQDAKDPLTGETLIDPDTGLKKSRETELLAKAFDLNVVGTGRLDSTGGDQEVLRKIDWKPAGNPLSGPFLLEVFGFGDDGKFVGNHLIVCFSDVMMIQKRSGTTVTLRLVKMSDGSPVANATIRALSKENFELARATSDEEGLAFFSVDRLFPAKGPQTRLYAAGTPEGPAFQFADASAYPSGRPEKPRKETVLRSFILTDRNLYRPGQTAKFSGFVRREWDGELFVPADEKIGWWITQEGSAEHIAEGSAALTAGGWDAEWPIPEKAALGEYVIHCRLGELQAEEPNHFKVQEYRVPLFSVIVEPRNTVGTRSSVSVSSAYFHGAPNAGSRIHWKAEWTIPQTESDDAIRRDDPFSEGALSPPVSQEKEGDALLDRDGVAILESDAPFAQAASFGRFEVNWRVDVTSVDGQTITGGARAALQSVPALPGVRCTAQYPARAIKVEVDAARSDNQPVNQLPVRVDLFHVTSKTVKEQLAPFVFRYRNTSRFDKVASQASTTPGAIVFPVTETGRYVATATGSETGTPVVSDETFISGEEYAEFPVENDTTFQLSPLGRKPFYRPGETAVFSVQAPFGGTAWVTIEAEEILNTLLVPIAGNSGRIALPIRKEYAPNAWVSVYLLQPGGRRDLPKERFACVPIIVRKPELELNIAPTLAAETVRPGETVKGEVTVTSGGVPVPDADLTVFAVDDAVLELGDWKLPDILSVFYPERPFRVLSFNALDHYVDSIHYANSIQRAGLTEKGFVIGDGGAQQFGNVSILRKEFRTLAYWKTGLGTDADGKASFQFQAPDNLTSYRIVAVGQTGNHQFGGSADKTVKVSKPLLVEPALPRFLREGDEVELRAVVRQNDADSEEVAARCIVDSKLTLMDTHVGPGAIQTIQRDIPAVFRFRVKVSDPDFSPSKVRFEVVSKTRPGTYDAVETVLPVHPATIVRKESVAGLFEGPAFNAPDKMPESWKQSAGHYGVTLSTCPWLPKITGLPLILDYPHGCFEQISTRLLGYSLLGDLLASLPEAQARDAHYRDAIQSGFALCDASLLPDGMLPYWSGSRIGSPFCTIEACWASSEAAKAGFAVPARLLEALPRAVRTIALESESPFLRSFALMVLGDRGERGDLTAAAEAVYLDRGRMSDEGRALLALALHRLHILPKEKLQLLSEIAWPIPERAFDPDTFASKERAEAICALAFSTISPPSWAGERQARARARISALMESSSALSTQENLWLLLTFKALGDAAPAPKLQAAAADLRNAAVSRNGVSAGWLDNPLPVQSDFTVHDLNAGSLSYVVNAEFSGDKVETDRSDRGFRVERVVRNLTKPKRTGQPDAPFKLGDSVLITYRLNTRKLQNYVALEDLLPAGLETVNPDLPSVAKFFEVPKDEHDNVLSLSHSEIRDQSTLLYFDRVDPGSNTYSVLARATAAGTFQWPATQVVPMYDTRFSGLSPSSVCVVTGD